MKKGWKIAGGVFIGVVAVAAAPITGGGSLLAGASALGLGTVTALGSAVVAGTAGGFLANVLSKDDILIKKGLVILGMQGAGKTTIYNFLRDIKHNGTSTNIDNYDEFEYSLDSKESIVIRKGIDMGGDDGFFKKYHEEMINDENIDFVFFVFNAFEYINNIQYMRQVNARLNTIYSKDVTKKNTVVIGSFKDFFDVKNQTLVVENIKSKTKNKPYAELLSKECFHLVNLTKKQDVEEIIKMTLLK